MIGLVARGDVVLDIREVNSETFLSQFLVAAVCALRDGGRQVDLDISARQHIRRDVAAIHEDAAALCHLALQVNHLLAHGAERSYLRDNVADLRCADLTRDVLAVDAHRRLAVLIREVHVDVGDDSEDLLIRDLTALLQDLPGHGAVHGPRVDVGITQFLGCELCDRALAGARRPVDCYYEFLQDRFPQIKLICTALMPAGEPA